MARACIALELVTAADVLRGEALDPGTSVASAPLHPVGVRPVRRAFPPSSSA